MLQRPVARALFWATLSLSFQPVRVSAHDIPSDATIHLLVKPEGRTLHVLARAPLGAMLDVDFPLRPSGNLDLSRAEGSLRDAAVLWLSNNIEIYEGDSLLAPPEIAAIRVSLPSDFTFASYEQATLHLTGPRLPEGTELPWEQGRLDVWFEYRIQSDRAELSIHPGLARLGIRVLTVLRFVLPGPPGGVVRAFELHGDPGLVRLDPRWHQAAFRFVELGFFHILDGTDHLLFLFCLLIPFRRFRALVWIVTSFTVAHSATLIASAFGLAPSALWFPPLVETLIAASIVYMALENIVGTKVQRRWMITFAFGLVHGFGFSFALRETLQFAGKHLLTSLLAFNVGVELGQILVLAVLLPLLAVLFRYVVPERLGTILLSAFIAHTGWHWMVERGATLGEFSWPALDAAFAARALRWLALPVAVAALVWLVRLRRRSERAGPPESAACNTVAED